ncbi:hypothetical protein [Nitrosopumilus sp.]|uniref:hypothetical protein n=1 Tax=Nitrosopumilus sp. TaxID=2024843 RepID=UPI002618B0AA|nr:hypothetical protein [Nitrosopumilus sp.]
MDKKIPGIIIGVAIIAIISGVFLTLPNTEVVSQKSNEKIGLVINTPFQSVSLQQIDEIFTDASSTGIGRSNVYLFWNIIEPERGNFDWKQSDVLMGLNEKNDLKVTLYFSVINGPTLGPFPNWIGKPSINSIGEDRLVTVLDEILSRYHIVDTVIIAGETESQFRYSPENIPVYQELFLGVYEKLKQKHPDVKFGNSFGLHHVLNKDLDHIVTDLAVGDFVAFSYFPVDSLNDIIKTPEQAKNDLSTVFEMVPDKKVVFFETSWSSSDFVGGDKSSQEEFMKEMFEFYSENESQIEFMTWYRQYDKPEGTCASERQDVGDESISVGGGSGLGSSDHVIERLNHYVCNAGLIEINGNPKPAWTEFKNQIELIK